MNDRLDYHGIPFIENSELVKPGQMVAFDDPYRGGVVFVHGLTLLWLRMDGEPNEVIHEASMSWIERRIEMLADQAKKRIDNMHRIRPVGVISEGPLIGRFAYEKGATLMVEVDG